VGTTITDTAGSYQFGVANNGIYSVYANKSGYAFTPAALPVSIGSGGSFANNFSATVVPAPQAVQLPKTGQTDSYYTGDDGNLQKGAVWPNPRFSDSGRGTVTDNLTGLVWLKNGNCTDDTVFGVSKSLHNGQLTFIASLLWSGALHSGSCGLSDGSQVGDWRLPNRNELLSLVDASQATPVLPVGHPFSNVQLNGYWTSSVVVNSHDGSQAQAYTLSWMLFMDSGVLNASVSSGGIYSVWPLRDIR
jgi:hypothetical protein